MTNLMPDANGWAETLTVQTVRTNKSEYSPEFIKGMADYFAAMAANVTHKGVSAKNEQLLPDGC